jgi:hypothetical protein
MIAMAEPVKNGCRTIQMNILSLGAYYMSKGKYNYYFKLKFRAFECHFNDPLIHS